VRVAPCILLLACVLAGTSGCQLFGKKNGGGNDGPFLGGNSTEKPKAPGDPLIGGLSGGPNVDGLLAGRVVDGTNQPADAQIRWVCIEDKEDESPIDIAVDRQGYFYIPGLKNGKHYKLITRAKSGDKTLEVITLAEAPNSRLVIQVTEKFAVPAGPDKSKPKDDKGKKSQANTKDERPTSGWQQSPPTVLPAADIYADKKRIAEDQGSVVKPPTMWTPPPLGSSGDKKWEAPIPKEQPHSPGSPAVVVTVTPGPAPVPSCVKVGVHLENFALNDLGLQPWELKTRRTGKVVLLDFWKTNCPPCLQTIPTLRILQDKYAGQGLEVIGIANEDGGTLPEQAHKVTAVAQERQVNYTLLLGGGKNCPLRRDLQVSAYPTLVLLDENGAVVWRHVGALDALQRDDLEFAIKRRLAPN
jgi:thiol-disulfide isomerase/thioredoxin